MQGFINLPIFHIFTDFPTQTGLRNSCVTLLSEISIPFCRSITGVSAIRIQPPFKKLNNPTNAYWKNITRAIFKRSRILPVNFRTLKRSLITPTWASPTAISIQICSIQSPYRMIYYLTQMLSNRALPITISLPDICLACSSEVQ